MLKKSGFIANLIIIFLTATLGLIVFFIYSSKSPLNNDDNIRILDDEQIAKFDEINLNEFTGSIKKVDVEIDSFEKCVEAGFSILESYPRKCSDGVQTYIEKVSSLGIRLLEPEQNNEVRIPFMIKGSVTDPESWNISEKYAGVFQIIDGNKQLITKQKISLPFVNETASTTREFEVDFDDSSWIGQMQSSEATIIIEEVALEGDDKKNSFNIPISFPINYLAPNIDISKWESNSNSNFQIAFKYPKGWNFFGDDLPGTQAVIGTIESSEKFENNSRFSIEIIAFDGTRYDSFLDVILENTEKADGTKPTDINDFEKIFINQKPAYGMQTRSSVKELGYNLFLADPRNDVVYRFKLLSKNIPSIDMEKEYGFRVLKALAGSFEFK